MFDQVGDFFKKSASFPKMAAHLLIRPFVLIHLTNRRFVPLSNVSFVDRCHPPFRFIAFHFLLCSSMQQVPRRRPQSPARSVRTVQKAALPVPSFSEAICSSTSGRTISFPVQFERLRYFAGTAIPVRQNNNFTVLYLPVRD